MFIFIYLIRLFFVFDPQPLQIVKSKIVCLRLFNSSSTYSSSLGQPHHLF